jgi:hypothetical protein
VYIPYAALEALHPIPPTNPTPRLFTVEVFAVVLFGLTHFAQRVEFNGGNFLLRGHGCYFPVPQARELASPALQKVCLTGLALFVRKGGFVATNKKLV